MNQVKFVKLRRDAVLPEKKKLMVLPGMICMFLTTR